MPEIDDRAYEFDDMWALVKAARQKAERKEQISPEANLLAAAIRGDLDDRSGLNLDNVDDEIKRHIHLVCGWIIDAALSRLREKLQSTVDQSEHFQAELHAAQVALSVTIMDRMNALAEVKRQEDVIKGTSVIALFELLDTVKPVQLNPGKVTFRKSDWQRIVTAIHAIRP